MRTNRINRFLALCLTLLMVLGMARAVIPAASAEAAALPASDWSEGVIAVTLNDKEGNAENVKVTAYKLVSVHTGQLEGTETYQPLQPEYTWEERIATWIRTNYPDYIDEDNSVKEAFDENKISAADAAELYAKIEAAIVNGEITGLEAKEWTDAGKITGLTMGVYLITATGGTAVYSPHVASITPEEGPNGTWTITNPAQVTLKSSPVTLVKTITEGQSAGVGDTVKYKLEVDVPTYPSQSKTETYIIRDTLPEGLTLKKNAENQYIVTIKDDEDNDLTASLADRLVVDEATRTMTIDLTPDAKKEIQNPIVGKTKLTITYDAILNEKAKTGTVGNVNEAELEYLSEPYTGKMRKAQAQAAVYTYGIEVTKVRNTQKEEQKEYLQGAEFELSDAAGTVIKFIQSGSTYVKALDQTEESTATTVLRTGAGGKLTIQGLAPGTYSLKETKAPAGYVLRTSTIQVTIADNNPDGNPNGIPDSEENKPNADNGLVKLEVPNTKGFTLPQTGGFGTMLFTMIGIVLMGGGVLLVAVFLRRYFRRAK